MNSDDTDVLFWSRLLKTFALNLTADRDSDELLRTP